MTSPKVSVVINTYNQQDFVRQTLDSVLAQTYPQIEIIVTDDGSIDETSRILCEFTRQYPDRIRTVLSDRNYGIPVNINRGLALVTGEMLVILDGDDLMLPEKIERQVRFIAAHPEATGCYHDVEVFVSDTGITLGRMSELYNGARTLRQGRLCDWLVPRNFFLPSAMMSRTSAVPQHGFDERMMYLSEVVFYAEVYHAGILMAFDDTLIRYRRHGGNITSNPVARDQMYEYEMLAYTILESRYPELYPVLHKLRTGCMLTEATKAYREHNRLRFLALIANVARQGAPTKALAVYVGLTLMGRRSTELTGSSTFTRPNWIKRLARRILS